MLLVLGSINADLLFKVETLPRPGETVLCPSYQMAIGGKGANQAAAAARAGAGIVFAGHVGNDAYGSVVRNMLAEAGVDCGPLKVADLPTAIAVIGVDRIGENAIIVASGANLETRAEQVEPFLDRASTLLCQNEIRPRETFAAIERAAECRCRTILNLAPAGAVPDGVLDALDILIVNQLEARAVSRETDPDSRSMVRSVAQKHGLTVVLTLGAEGAYATDGSWSIEVPAMPVDAVDTTGAGDCFSGVLAARLDDGLAIGEALEHAAAAAALSCLAVGAQSAQPSDAQIRQSLSIGFPAVAKTTIARI